MSEIAELSAQDPDLLRLLARGLPLDAVARLMYTSVWGRLGFGASIQAVVWPARRGPV
jgi:hypothetical protein